VKKAGENREAFGETLMRGRHKRAEHRDEVISTETKILQKLLK